MLNGGKIIVKALHAQGVKRVFCVAGESYLPVLDGFVDYPDIDVITCRHESGATFMAEAEANLTGRPGVALATRGPGACNASIGIHTARQSSTPMIFLVGLINTGDRDREAFQEFDIAQMFGSLAKWATVIDRTDRIAEYMARAFHVAQSGRPGPVVLGLPEEIVFSACADQPVSLIPTPSLKPNVEDMAAIRHALEQSQRPLAIIGGGGWSEEACQNFASFAKTCHLPVAAAFRRIDLMDHANSNYIGDLGFGPNPALIERVKKADLLLFVGDRMDEITAQSYSLIQPGQKVIHACPGEHAFGQGLTPHIVVQAHSGPLAAALAGEVRVDGRNWAAWKEEARAEFISWTEPHPAKPGAWKGADMTAIFAFLREALPKDAVISTDAGNFSGWAYRFLRYQRPGRMVAPVAGAMGYGVPGAVAASLTYPDRVCLGICGDGGFMMTAQELATAAHHKAKPVILVCNNNMYGTIRMHQDKTFPGRESATALTNPDFVKFAESFGAFGARVQKAEDFPAVWQQALQSGRAAVIEIVMDPRQITTGAKP